MAGLESRSEEDREILQTLLDEITPYSGRLQEVVVGAVPEEWHGSYIGRSCRLWVSVSSGKVTKRMGDSIR